MCWNIWQPTQNTHNSIYQYWSDITQRTKWKFTRPSDLVCTYKSIRTIVKPLFKQCTRIKESNVLLIYQHTYKTHVLNHNHEFNLKDGTTLHCVTTGMTSIAIRFKKRNRKQFKAKSPRSLVFKRHKRFR